MHDSSQIPVDRSWLILVLTNSKEIGMQKNLNTGDHLVKITLATLTVIFYFTDAISGPFAQVLVILSIALLIFYLIKMIASHD